MRRNGFKRHYVLVHGACHGAWCWYKVANLLEAAGHQVTAIDLATCGINPKQPNDIHSFLDYVEPLLSFMEVLPTEEKLVLVGHSMGGHAISIAMERFPQKVAAGIFVSAFMPGPNLTMSDINQEVKNQKEFVPTDNKYTYDQDNCMTSFLFGPKYLEMLYALSPKEDLRLATFLARPHPCCSDEKLMEETRLTNELYGSVHRTYIMNTNESRMSTKLQKWMIEKNPPDEVMLIPDSDHMVMTSKPQVLCFNLLAIAAKYC